MSYIKSENNGHWYPDKTQWRFIHDALCDALGYFSEEDNNSQLYIMIDRIADMVFDIYKKNEC